MFLLDTEQIDTASQPDTMSESLAAELLADFDDSDNEDQVQLDETEPSLLNGNSQRSRSNTEDFGMELDGDEEQEDEDEDMGGVNGDLDAGDDAEARKAKVEKMQLGSVDDVRSVAGLMKVLTPVLEV